MWIDLFSLLTNSLLRDVLPVIFLKFYITVAHFQGKVAQMHYDISFISFTRLSLGSNHVKIPSIGK
jgi:hypothetical protein